MEARDPQGLLPLRAAALRTRFGAPHDTDERLMTKLLLAAGLCAGAALVVLMLLTLSRGPIRIWPTPGDGTWQSLTFWFLFRTLNVTALLVVLADWGSLGLVPVPLRGLGLALAAVCLALYLRSLASLGPPNTYCRRAGLVDRGPYRWTRNPQYAAIIPAYAGLALAADSAPACALIVLATTVYVLMALAEEPWLRTAYPGAYDRYARRVPRFYNWRRARALLRLGRRQLRPLRRRLGGPAVRHLAATGLPRKRP
jgi:protein-S-isoprenylcysteine O-methyltransferase Ste14